MWLKVKHLELVHAFYNGENKSKHRNKSDLQRHALYNQKKPKAHTLMTLFLLPSSKKWATDWKSNRDVLERMRALSPLKQSRESGLGSSTTSHAACISTALHHRAFLLHAAVHTTNLMKTVTQDLCRLIRLKISSTASALARHFEMYSKPAATSPVCICRAEKSGTLCSISVINLLFQGTEMQL